MGLRLTTLSWNSHILPTEPARCPSDPCILLPIPWSSTFRSLGWRWILYREGVSFSSTTPDRSCLLPSGFGEAAASMSCPHIYVGMFLESLFSPLPTPQSVSSCTSTTPFYGDFICILISDQVNLPSLLPFHQILASQGGVQKEGLLSCPILEQRDFSICLGLPPPKRFHEFFIRSSSSAVTSVLSKKTPKNLFFLIDDCGVEEDK